MNNFENIFNLCFLDKIYINKRLKNHIQTITPFNKKWWKLQADGSNMVTHWPTFKFAYFNPEVGIYGYEFSLHEVLYPQKNESSLIIYPNSKIQFWKDNQLIFEDYPWRLVHEPQKYAEDPYHSWEDGPYGGMEVDYKFTTHYSQYFRKANKIKVISKNIHFFHQQELNDLDKYRKEILNSLDIYLLIPEYNWSRSMTKGFKLIQANGGLQSIFDMRLLFLIHYLICR